MRVCLQRQRHAPGARFCSALDRRLQGRSYFFFSSRRRHTRFKCDWSSDVCSSDLSLRVSPGAVFVALHEVGNPGNLGTIIRTADAAGGAGVVLIGAAADPFDPVAVKASMGALFAVPVAGAADAAEFFAWAAGCGVSVVATSAKARASFWAASYARPLALLLGAEGAGLPDDLLAAGDLQVRIPMTGTAESLNLAVAAGLLLYQARRPDLTGPAEGRRSPGAS